MPHPTGLTHHEEIGTFIGNTTDQLGTIYQVVWWGFKQSGSLDTWIPNRVIDDLATNGTRPEFVRWGDRWLIATADNANEDGQLRFYDPERLKQALNTSDEGVLVASFDCRSNVQGLHWIDEENTLVLMRYSEESDRSLLTLMQMGEEGQAPTAESTLFFSDARGPFTGFAVVEPGWAILTSPSAENNVSFIRWPIE